MPGVSSGFPPSFRQGWRPFWGGDRGSDGCQEPEPLCWGPQLIPSPGGRGPEGAGRRAGGAPRSSAHLSQSAQAQVKLGGIGRAAAAPADSLARKAAWSTHVLGSGRLVLTEPKWRREHARLSCFFSALVPVTPTGLGTHYASLDLFGQNIARFPAAKQNTAVKDSLFYHSTV